MRNRWLVFILLTNSMLAMPAYSQARYDNHQTKDKFSIRIGGFHQEDIDSNIRIDSKSLGLGTIISLEDNLNVGNSLGVVRIDGHYRFNNRHRIEWAWFSTKRDGTATVVNNDLQIGDEIFEVGTRISTEWDSDLLKAGWSWSYINVERYEFYLGAGLNIRKMSLKFDGVLATGEEIQQETFDEGVTAPLPTFNFGGTYNFTNKLSLQWRFELFGIEAGDFEGSFQDTYFLVEHNTFKNVGFGGGLNSFNFDLTTEDDDLRGEIDTSYTGFLLYVKAYF